MSLYQGCWQVEIFSVLDKNGEIYMVTSAEDGKYCAT